MNNAKHTGRLVALSGGVGGAKLALGLARQLPPERLVIACNTGDDFEHLGLSISPDLDTVMYTLAGISHPEQGWGLAGESWRVMSQMEILEGPAWFRLGDLDLATHLYRTQRLREGATLSQVTQALCGRLNVGHAVLPMSDHPVRTLVQTDAGELSFQHYFVRERCQPVVRGLRFEGSATAAPQPQLAATLADASLAGIVICPSNPFLSIGPMLSIPALRQALRSTTAPVIAVSPIVAGQSIKGPTAKMMSELGMSVTAGSIAACYHGLIDGIVIDESDASQARDIEAMGIAVHVARTIMRTLEDKRQLADDVLAFAAALFRHS